MKKIFYFFAALALVATTACNKDDENSLQFEDIQMNVGETFTIENGNDATWVTTNSDVVSVSGNVLTAECAGEAVITSDLGSFTVVVVPTDFTFAEPDLVWGSNMSSVKAFMDHISTALLIDEEENKLTYSTSGDVLYYIYNFEDGLSESVMMIDGTVNSETVMDFLSQRYYITDVDEEEGVVYMVSTDLDTAVAVFVDEDGDYQIYYEPVPEAEVTRGLDFSAKKIFADNNKVFKASKEGFKKLKSAL